MKNKRIRVLVAMSGGVDSSVSAGLLLKKGFDVLGITMRLPVTDLGMGDSRVRDAGKVADKLGIKHFVLDCKEEFKRCVIDYFTGEYINGCIPNPCAVCNSKIKFGLLMTKLKEYGADYLATGHYVRCGYDKVKKRYILKRGKDLTRDQAYFLFMLDQNQLSRVLFPLGELTKKKVRMMAVEFAPDVHDKPESRDVCFIANADYRSFIEVRGVNSGLKEGDIVNNKGEVVGKHKGVAFFTIGQRKGVGAHKTPHYVIRLDAGNNQVIIGKDKDLYKNELIAQKANLIDRKSIDKKIRVKAKIRYAHKEAYAVVFPLENNRIKVVFDEPQRAITPGQAVVLYDRDVVVGGGWIEKAGASE